MVQVDKSPENLALLSRDTQSRRCLRTSEHGLSEAELDYFVTDAQPQLFVGAEQRAGVMVFDP